jgi:hypothetical protein
MRNKILLMNVLLIIFLCFPAACGKVGDPRPRLPQGDASRLDGISASDLTLSQSPWGVLLTWRFHGASLPEKVKIYRADFNIEEGDCQDCPPLQKGIIRELSGEELKDRWDGEGYSYEDMDIRQGFVYKYSLQICTAQDVCRDPFPEAVVRIEMETE